MVCPICLDSILNGEPLYTMHCGHAIHRECLKVHTRTSSRCPTCRRRFNHTWRLYLDENNIQPTPPINHLLEAEVNALAAAVQDIQIPERAAEAIINELINDVVNSNQIVEEAVGGILPEAIMANDAIAVEAMRPCYVRLDNIEHLTSEHREETPRREERPVRERRMAERFNYNRLKCCVCHRYFAAIDFPVVDFDLVCDSCVRRQV